MKRVPRTVGCPTELALALLGGKWKTVILARLKERPLRYAELRARIPALSDKMLTQCLRELQERGLVVLLSSPAGAARYGLTSEADSLRPVLQQLYEWGEAQARRLDVRVLDRLDASSAAVQASATSDQT